MPTDASDDVVLRPAGAADAAAIAEVYLAARRSADMPPGVHTDEEVRAWLASRVHQDEVWVAEVADAVAAYARMTTDWLDDLYVEPGRARRGIGSALMDLAKARRPEGFCLWVFEMNHGARAFYARHGLVELERTDGQANEERSPDIRMAWPGADGLTFYRRLIDAVDEQLGDLLARRVALTSAVQALKSQGGKPPPRDPGREREIAGRLSARAPALGPERAARIVHAIVSESLDASR